MINIKNGDFKVNISFLFLIILEKRNLKNCFLILIALRFWKFLHNSEY